MRMRHTSFVLVATLALLACGDGGASAPPIGEEHTGVTPILDAAGNVVARGWARGPLFEFDRAAVPAARVDRIREWDFYAVHAATFAVMVTLAEVRFEGRGHFVSASVSVQDFASGKALTGSLLLPDDAALDLGPRAGGNYRVEAGSGWLEYSGGPAARRITCDLPADSGERVTAEIDITIPDDESIAVVTPFSDPGFFFYENKVDTMPARGFVAFGAQRFELPEGAAFAVMDWVRAVMPHTIDWTWAVGVGEVGGRRVGLNLGTVFGDDSAGTPDAVIVDGVLHKLPKVDWDTSDATGAWRFRDAAGRVDLRLVPSGYRETQDLDLGFYKTSLNKPYGTWSGTVELDDGRRLVVDGLVGAAEEVHTEW